MELTRVVHGVGVLEVINSLSRNEGKHVRKALVDAGKRYFSALVFFDIINAEKCIDQVEANRLGEAKGISNIHRCGKILMDFILNYLSGQMVAEESVDQQLWHTQSMGSLLWRKGFKEQAIAVLEAGIKGLVLEDHPEQVLTLLTAQERMIRGANFDLREERHSNYRSQRNAALKIIANREAINDLSEEAFQLRKLFYAGTHPDVEKRIQKIIDDPLLQNEMTVLSFTAKIRFHVALGFCYTMLADSTKTLYHHKAVVDTWEARPDQQKLKPRTHQQAILNYLFVCVRYKQHDNIEFWYQKAVAIEIKDKAESAAGFFATSNFWLYYLINNKPMDAGREFLQEMEEGMATHKEHLDDDSIVGLWFNLADLMYLSDQNEQAIRYYKKVANKKSSQRKDLMGVSKMMIMLMKFERNSPTYIDSLNKQARRYFRNNPEVDTLNAMVYVFMGKLLAAPESEEQLVLEIFQQNLNELEKAKGSLSGIEEVRVWILSNLTRKTYGQVWQDKIASS